MPYLRQLFLGLACASLLACAAGVPGDELDFAAEEATLTTPQLDAGLPPLAAALPAAIPSTPASTAQPAPANPSVSPGSSPATVPSTATFPQDAGTSTPIMSTPVPTTPAPVTPPSTTPPTSTQDAGSNSSSTRDAGSTTPATPPPAPMCSPLKCNINCALLRPCCDQQNQCMCLSPIRGCVLPPL